MAHDARFRRPNVVTRSGSLVYTYIEFYGVVTTTYTEIAAYNSVGQMLYYPFTDADSIMYAQSSGVVTQNGIQPRTVGLVWVFDSPAIAAQAARIRVWLWMDGLMYDTYMTP